MRERWKTYRTRLVDEKTREWLFIKGFGGAIPLAIAFFIAYIGFSSLNLSSSSMLGQQLNEAQERIDSYRDSVDSLKAELNSYESNRFMLRNGEVRYLFSDIWVSFEEYSGFSGIRIGTSDSVIDSLDIGQVGQTIRFTVNDQQYIIMVLKRLPFSPETFFRCDSIQVYWDSLNTH